MKQPQVLRKTRVGHGAEVSSIFVPTGNEGGYFETMLFLDRPIEGLKNFETYNEFASWVENHQHLVEKVRNALK